MMCKVASELLTSVKFHTRPTYLFSYNIQKSKSRKIVIVRLILNHCLTH